MFDELGKGKPAGPRPGPGLLKAGAPAMVGLLGRFDNTGELGITIGVKLER